MKPTVLIEKIALNTEDIKAQFMRAFSMLSLDKDFNDARAIFIKPNLTYPEFKQGVTTRVEFIDILVSTLRSINSTTMIYIGEGEGGYHSFSMTDAMHTMGFFHLEKKYENIKIINLSKIPSENVILHVNKKTYNIMLPSIFFNEIDFSISCPVPKVHCMTKITLSLKNIWGCLPDPMRLKNHYVFDSIISQISNKLKFRYAFLDGQYGLDHNGPIVGKTVSPDWFVASNSTGAMDMVVSEMMGFQWKKIKYLNQSNKLGLLPRFENIKRIGDIEKYKKTFCLKRSFWNYPALLAFNSSKLTQLVYFSKWADILHRIMYTFRSKPIK